MTRFFARSRFILGVIFLASALGTVHRSWGFYEGFDLGGTIEEDGSMSQSSSPSWWVSSGGRLLEQGSLGMTIQGWLPDSDFWRVEYASSNPVDTDNGYRPQNIFRLVARGQWMNFQQQVHFRISSTNMTDSPNRNASNGVLFFHRYQDSNSLYYAGIRVDGAAVVKKKLNGVYTTLGYQSVYSGSGPFDRNTNPNLLPVDKWLGLRTTIRNDASGGVAITVDLEDSSLGSGWVPVLEASDTGTTSSAILAAGDAGIRTDFMDVQFDSYRAEESCAASLSPTGASFAASGGSESVSVTVPAGCPWSATSSESWISLTAGISGDGSATLSYSVAPNSQIGSRSGALTIAGQTLTVTQEGMSCSDSISPASQTFGSSGGSGLIKVTAPAGCKWSAASNAKRWIRVNSGSTGAGEGTVIYSVSANKGRKSRTGTLTAAGQTFTVTQAR